MKKSILAIVALATVLNACDLDDKQKEPTNAEYEQKIRNITKECVMYHSQKHWNENIAAGPKVVRNAHGACIHAQAAGLLGNKKSFFARGIMTQDSAGMMTDITYNSFCT